MDVQERTMYRFLPMLGDGVYGVYDGTVYIE